MKYTKSLIFISLLSLFSSYATSTTAESVDVERLNSRWVSSFEKGNTKALMDLYTENAMVFPPSSEILEGQIAIAAYLNSLKEIGVTEYSISNVDTEIKGDTAYETALWEATRIDANGATFNFEGNITNVLERQNDGSWKIKLQSWN
jgi:ketosteroid isomerase-like protein